MSVLYISYDGMLDQLGQSQVRPYLKRLAVLRPIFLISFEKGTNADAASGFAGLKDDFRTEGIRWRPLTYHKNPRTLATVYDLLMAVLHGTWLVYRHRIKVVHSRSLLAAIPGLILKKFTGVSFIFDIRGFWVDCRAEQGRLDRASFSYKVLKWMEMHCLMNADVVTSLTHKGIRIMQELPYMREKSTRFEMITTCTDMDLFLPTEKRARPFTLGYVGSVGSLYKFEEVLECFKVLCEFRTEAKLLVINRADHVEIRRLVSAHHIPAEKVEIETAEYRDVPLKIQKMDAGICFVLPTPSMAAAAPTKIGEYLACGVPIIANTQPGDLEVLLDGTGIGVGVSEFSETAYRSAWNDFFGRVSSPETQRRCVEFALKEFSLEKGAGAYERIYRDLGV